MPTAVVLAVTLSLASPAGAILEDLNIQTQAQYQLFEVKQQGMPVESRGGFTTTYNIALRRPLTPLSKLITNLTINSIENNDSLGRQQNRTTNFSLSTSERSYTLNAGIDNITYRSIISGPDGAPIESNGGNRNYHLNFTWNEPAWPTTNIQYRSHRTTSGVGSNYTNSQWITGAFYEFRPFRVTVDRVTQDFKFTSAAYNNSGSSTTRRRSGIEFDERILPGLNFQANFNRESTRNRYSAGRSTGLDGDTRIFRLTATPTPSLLLSAERSSQDTRQNSGTLFQSIKTTNTTYSLRSEMLPGLLLNVNHQTGEQIGDTLANINKNTSANISARLTSDANLNLGWVKTSFDDIRGTAIRNDQTSMYASLQMPLGLNNDFTADIGSTRSISLDNNRVRGRYAGFTLRNRTRSDMALGLGYRWNWLESTGAVDNIQKTNSLDFDISWFPTMNMGINARLSYSSNNGTSISDYITPTVDVRWDISSDSNLTFRYNFNRTRQWDWLRGSIFQQQTRGMSGRFSHRLTNDSSMDITYDFLGSDGGGLEWQRALRVYYTMRL